MVYIDLTDYANGAGLSRQTNVKVNSFMYLPHGVGGLESSVVERVDRRRSIRLKYVHCWHVECYENIEAGNRKL